jgi:hypothetical protein
MHLPLTLVVAALLFVAWPADAGDTPCSKPAEIERGDHQRLLRVWACGYSSDSGVAERGRIVMATYRKLSDGSWYPVTSESITLEDSSLWDTKDQTLISFGKSYGNDTCRIGSPAGSIGCSVPNTPRVTFYSRAWDTPPGHQMFTDPFLVSWRDDQGYAHPFKMPLVDPNDPELKTIRSPDWTSK